MRHGIAAAALGSSIALAIALAGCTQELHAVDAAARADGGGIVDARSALDAASAADAPTPVDAAVADAQVDAPLSADADSRSDAGTAPVDAGADAPADAGSPDAGSLVFDVRVLADGACSDLSFDPPSISVPAGTSFTVNWINATGCTPIDIDKGGTVPIVIGLEPGTSYHDTVREWCGTLFTGTFFFRAYYAPSFPYYLDVDCSA